ncbi:hypothetical protein B0E33_27705 [Roseibium algicola]|jgi:hypothetical protein|uniref:Uncharacterized protein n=1 Tax=Roseibium algicola TaxID=2857014 RepID=A0ABM6I8U4_9HYPH|nr:hypothetical protein ACP90_15865 [Labrenzia sp. CP4]AQQ06898.1 hypothetical protein B0E33_27705 [Roseibium aggregatum]
MLQNPFHEGLLIPWSFQIRPAFSTQPSADYGSILPEDGEMSVAMVTKILFKRNKIEGDLACQPAGSV